MKIEIPIPALTQNVYYRKFQNRLIISKRGKEYKELVNTYIQSYPKILGKVKLDLVFYFKDKRKRDLDNLLRGMNAVCLEKNPFPIMYFFRINYLIAMRIFILSLIRKSKFGNGLIKAIQKNI